MSALNYKKTSADKSGSLFAIVDGRIPKGCEAGLSEIGFEVIKLEADERLGEAVSSHTDMLLFRSGNTIVGSKSYFEAHRNIFDKIANALPNFEFILSDEIFSPIYPHDAIFNALTVGKKLFAKCDTASSTVLALAKRENLEIISVKQGYPACTVLALQSSFAITSDKGMANVLKENGVRTLIIEESEAIKLPPYKNGFIGGCAGVLNNTVYFLGNLLSHPHGEKIRDALASEGYSALSLDAESDSLFDLGGMILISTDKNGNSTRPKNPKSE